MGDLSVIGRGVVLALALLALTAVVSRPSPDAGAAGTRVRIAYERCSRTNRAHWCGSDIYVLNGVRSRPRRLTHSAGADDHNPRWSPDGTRVAFWREPEADRSPAAGVYLIRADGTGERQLVRGAAYPSWSPDGARIAFGRNGVYVIGVDGGGLRRIAKRGGQPAWSPDGRKIAFAKNNGRYTEIDVMNADGGGERRVTRAGRAGENPQWLPDGRSIAFSWYDGITVVDATTGAPRRDRFPPLLASSDPTWSPDGTEVVFSATRAVFYDLYVMAANGSHVRRITGTGADEFGADWYPSR